METSLRPSRRRIDIRPTRTQPTLFNFGARPSALRKLPTMADLPYRVLLIAEDNVHRQLVTMVLLGNDMRVTLAQTAAEAAEAFTQEMPHIVLVDWDVDGIDGRAILRAIRTNQETRKLPVLVMTNLAVTENLNREMGMYGVQWILEKPIVPLSLPRLIIRTISGGSPSEQAVGSNRRRAFLVDCGQSASGVLWKSV